MKYKKQISLLLCIVMVVTISIGYFPAYAKETANAEIGKHCIHHPNHTPECGYTPPTEGSPCTHQHNETCGYVEGVEGSCTHQHDENCGYSAPSEGTPCSYEVNGCPYCVTSWKWADIQGMLSESDSGWSMNLPGVSQDNRMTRDTLAELLPSQITAVTDKGEEKTLDITWDLSAIPEEGACEGDYRVTASLADSNYAFTDNVITPAVNVQLEGKGTYAAAENSCIHHPYHTPECGYTEAGDEATCSYEANGCPYCVTSWEWVDNQGALNESDGGWTMGLPGVNQDNMMTRDILAELLPSQITAVTDNGEEKTLDITWDLSPIPEEGTYEGDYQVTASLADNSYALVEGTAALAVMVQLGGADTYNLQMPSGTPPFSDHIVNGVSPNGTTINLFDYWITSQDASDNTDPADLTNQGINKDHALLFFKNGRGKWNQWTNSKNPFSGIVKDHLENGYPVLNNLDTNNMANVKGRDGNESLRYLFDPSYNCDGKASYSDVQGLLQVDDDGYYYYNSQWNYAAYYQDTNSFTLYDNPGIIPGGSSPVGQFFPFNEATANAESALHKGQSYTLMNKLKSDNIAINHYFGIHMSTRFIQQYGGHTSDPENGGKEVTYEFSGDDDVWIFIDGTLVGDLGGIHDAASIKINFATGTITVNDKVQTETLGKLLGLNSNTLTDNTYHTLDFFFLERGNYDSNMSLRYNLVTIPESGVIKVDQVGNKIYGAEFALYSAKDYEGNKTDATPIASGETDANGEFIFITETGDGENRPITIAELYDNYMNDTDTDGNNLVLVETKTPPGYRNCGPIGLRFYRTSKGEVLLLSSTDSIWNQGAYAMPKVTATTETSIELLSDPTDVTGTSTDGTVRLLGSDADESPTMFAVVFQKKDDNNWYPVSGDPLSGWDVRDSNNWDSILDAAKKDSYIFQLASSGAYQVEIENLPGNVMDYYHICGDKDTAQYTIAYYYTTADSLSEATQANTWRINADLGDYPLQRAFSMNLYVTNMKNRLLVQKVDDDGNTVNGAQFSLYKASEVTVTNNSDGTQSVTPVEGASPAVVTTGDITTPVNLTGAAVFPDNLESGSVLENGEYWLIESSAPVGYKIKTNPVHVVVDNTGVYADAGTENDGVTVLRGIGSVARSMIQFAVDDGVDITLRDVKAALANQVEYSGDYHEDGNFIVNGSGIKWDSKGDDVLHLQYANTNKMLDYGLQGKAGETVTLDDLTLETDVGWSKLLIRQCYQHNDSVNVKLKTDLGERDITNLFSGTVTVRVANDKTGNLKISKKVTGDGAPADQEFTFQMTVKNDSVPISGTYETLDGGNTRGNLSFKDGMAEVKLKANESLTVLALPAGAEFTVQEMSVPERYEPKISVTEGCGMIINQETYTVTGTIQHNTSETSAMEAAYTNEFDGSTTARLKGSKTLHGRNLTSEDTFTFSIAAGDESTTQAISGGQVELPGNTSVTVQGDGTGETKDFIFDPITFNTEGTYKFIITEQSPSGATQDNPVTGDIWYDTHTTTVTVTVTRDSDTGILQAVPTYDNTADDDTDKAVFINRWAGLKISKTVSGDMGDRDKLFNFTIVLQDAGGNALTGSYPCIIGTTTGTLSLDNSGKAEFQLKHGQTITIFGLPAGSKYTVSEPDAQADGYTTKVTLGEKSETAYTIQGNLSETDTVEVSFENSRGNIPVTGIRIEHLPWILLITVVIISVVLILITKKRKLMIK